MKIITRLITGKQEFILASTQPKDAFAKLGKFVAINAEHVTDGKTNRVLTGLDVLTADTLDGIVIACNRFAKQVEYMKAHPMPAFDPENPSPEAREWFKADIANWAKNVHGVTI